MVKLLKGTFKYWDLVQKTIGLSSPDQSSSSRFIWYVCQENVQMILKHEDISMFTIPQLNWQEIEELCALHSQRSSSCIPDSWRSRQLNLSRYCFSACSITSGCKIDIVPRYQSLAHFPDENHGISFSPSLLTIKSQVLKFLPIRKALKTTRSDSRDQRVLDSLNSVNFLLVSW